MADRAGAVLSVQRMAGNRAVRELLRSPDTAVPSRVGTKRLIKIVGAKQGAFKGDGPGGAIVASKVHLGVVAPHDAATGAALGKRQHKPITFEKPVDGSTTQLLQALSSNEVLTTVQIQTFRDGPAGSETFETIELRNASITSFDQDLGDNGDTEVVALTFETIEVTNAPSNTAASDTWSK